MAMRRPKAIGTSANRVQPYGSKPGGAGLSLKLDKNLGQHLLRNPGILDKIVTAAEIKSTDTVLEIGPGTGNLTMRLLPIARKVVALDVDERMVGEVKKRAMSLGYTNLNACYGDALRTDFGTFDVCTANMPYQISSPFIFKLLAHRPLFRSAVLMFQKEFAERLCAQPNDKFYCRLAINTQIFCRVERICLVKAANFSPPPKVDSMVVRLTPRKPQLKIDFREWDGMIRVCFGRKRRTLNSNFTIKPVLHMLEYNYKAWCSVTGSIPEIVEMKDLIKSVLEEAQLSERRAVTISIEEYFQLLLAFNKKGIHFCNITGANSDAKKDDPFGGLQKDWFMNIGEDIEKDEEMAETC
ncbi:probable dimethyladenosine transferase [Condylostylus longicornis]|uniref:probable dimethyladenosine transferase n=1 Tax=Condylostylus longicornis TaxID=2530218 RepID=UPI00244DAFD2|nr:probable dimethyladenosine transferase [Condylostylus longicornis]